MFTKDIKKEFWVYKIVYFILGAMLSLSSFDIVAYLLNTLKISDELISVVLFSLGQLLIFLLFPIIGKIADKYNIHQHIIKISSLITLITILIFPFLTNNIFALVTAMVISFVLNLLLVFLDRSSNIFATRNNLEYSEMRLYASFGFGITLLALSILKINNSFIIFNLSAIALLVLSVMFKIGYFDFKITNTSDQPKSKTILNKDVLLFIIFVALLTGSGLSLIYMYATFLFAVYGTSAQLYQSIGIFLGSLIVEILCFKIYPFIRNKVNKQIFVLIILVGYFRYSLPIFTDNPIALIITFSGHGFIFAFLWSELMRFINERVEEKSQQTIISYYNSINSIGMLLSTLIIPILASIFNDSYRYAIFSYVLVTLSIGMLIYLVKLRKIIN